MQQFQAQVVQVAQAQVAQAGQVVQAQAPQQLHAIANAPVMVVPVPQAAGGGHHVVTRGEYMAFWAIRAAISCYLTATFLGM